MRHHRHFFFLPAGLLPLLLLCIPASVQAALAPAGGTANFLLQKSISLTETIAETAADPQALSMYTANPDMRSAADAFAGLDAENPLQAYLLTLPNSAFLAAAAADADSSPETEEFQLKQFIFSFARGLFANSYTTQDLAFCSILTETAYWVRPADWAENALVFLVYDDGLVSVSTFMETDSGYLTGKCELLPAEAGKLLTDAAVLFSRLSDFVETPEDCITELNGGEIRQLITANPDCELLDNDPSSLPADKETFLLETGLELVQRMGNLARSDLFISLGYPEEMAGYAATFGESSYAEPSLALSAACSMEALQAVLEQFPSELTEQLGDDTENLLPELQKLLENPVIKRRLASALPISVAGILWSSQSGATAYASANALKTDQIMALPEYMTENTLLLLQYDDACSAFVSFICYPEEHVLLASALFLPRDLGFTELLGEDWMQRAGELFPSLHISTLQ